MAMNALLSTKKFAKNRIDIPLPASTPVHTPGSDPSTCVFEVATQSDYGYPTIELTVTHSDLDAPVDVKLSKLIRQITITGTGLPEPMIIDGPSLEFISAAVCALITPLGQMPNYNSVYKDDGFEEGTTSEAIIALPAILRPGKYQFECQYSGYEPAGVTITDRAFAITGIFHELPQDGMYFCGCAKRVINSFANGTALGHFSGKYIVLGNPDVGMGIMGGEDASHVNHENIGMRFITEQKDEFQPSNRVIKQGVNTYARWLNPGDEDLPQVYMHPMDFTDINLTRPTAFDVVLVHLFCKP